MTALTEASTVIVDLTAATKDDATAQLAKTLADAGRVTDLDGFLAEPFHVGADPVAVIGGLVHHLAVGLAEPDVVLEEVVMTIDMGHDELLVNPLVAPEEIGAPDCKTDNGENARMHETITYANAMHMMT